MLLLLPLRAEDWTTNDGKVYKNVRVISETPAYVTIMHADGGGQVPLSNLSSDLQQRFHYSPEAAAKYLADTAAAKKAGKDALAKEKAQVVQAQEAAKREAEAEAFFIALFTLPPDRDVAAPKTVAQTFDDSVPPPDYVPPDATPIASEPPTEIDDWGSGYGYAPYGYYSYGGYSYYPYYSSYGYRGYHGYRGYRGGWGSGHHASRGYNPANVQVNPRH